MPLPDPALIAAESCHYVPGWQRAEPRLEPILKGGSDRCYYRCGCASSSGPDTCILMLYTDNRPDNPSYFPATDVLHSHGVRVPHIYHHDASRKVAWIEDLGAADLWEHRLDAPTEVRRLYRSALRQAARVHALTPEGLGQTVLAKLQRPFDADYYGWEQNYFFDEFASRFSTATPETLERVRHHPQLVALREELAALPRCMVHRDFQSQNIVIKEGKAWLIDFQGLRPGRGEYDVASLLWDPYVELPDEDRVALADYYFEYRRREHGWDGSSARTLAQCAIQRLMQALGAYGKLSHRDGKHSFLAHVKPALARLRSIVETHDVVPVLEEVLHLRPGALEAPAEAAAA